MNVKINQRTGHTEYRFNIKYYHWENTREIEAALDWAFGFYSHKDGGHFELIDDHMNRRIRASIDGRSGGWLVIQEELSEAELAKLTAYVESVMKALPDFLAEERVHRKEEAEEAAREEQAARDKLKADPRVRDVLTTLHEIAGTDFKLLVRGIDVRELMKGAA